MTGQKKPVDIPQESGKVHLSCTIHASFSLYLVLIFGFCFLLSTLALILNSRLLLPLLKGSLATLMNAYNLSCCLIKPCLPDLGQNLRLGHIFLLLAQCVLDSFSTKSSSSRE